MPQIPRGADLLIESLINAGVHHLFVLSGNQIMSAFDASIGAQIQLIHVRHEAAAVHMADAWGRITGSPGIALVTAGPGFANTISALYVARMAESPVVLLSGHAPRRDLGRGAFQEMPQAEIAAHVTKASWTVQRTGEIPAAVTEAWQTATAGRPGPVHVALPVDVLESRGLPGDPATGQDPEHTSEVPVPAELAGEFSQAVSQARRPLILAGPAFLRGDRQAALQRLGQTLSAPTVGMESPRGTNDPHLGAFAELLPQCDLLLLIGKSLDFTLPLDGEFAIPADSRIMQIDADPTVLDQSKRLVDASRLVTWHADPSAAIEEICRGSCNLPATCRQWSAEVADALAYRPGDWPTLQSEAGRGIHPLAVGAAVQRFLAGDSASVFISDGGEFGQWMQAVVTASVRIINGPSGAIGSALPLATAARIARPASRLVTVLGDGTFGFLPLEFDTALRYQLPLVAVVGNDAKWNAEHLIQVRKYGPGRTIGCDLRPTRYDLLVEALGGFGAFVERADQLDDALQQAYASGLPACVNVALQAAPAPIIRRGGRYSK